MLYLHLVVLLKIILHSVYLISILCIQFVNGFRYFSLPDVFHLNGPVTVKHGFQFSDFLQKWNTGALHLKKNLFRFAKSVIIGKVSLDYRDKYSICTTIYSETWISRISLGASKMIWYAMFSCGMLFDYISWKLWFLWIYLPYYNFVLNYF